MIARLDGSAIEVRVLDIALLFDETRNLGPDLCEHFRDSLRELAPGLRYPFNEPHRGDDDGLTTTLRSVFPTESYLGIEIEVRQGMIREAAQQRDTGDLLARALLDTARPIAPR